MPGKRLPTDHWMVPDLYPRRRVENVMAEEFNTPEQIEHFRVMHTPHLDREGSLHDHGHQFWFVDDDGDPVELEDVPYGAYALVPLEGLVDWTRLAEIARELDAAETGE